MINKYNLGDEDVQLGIKHLKAASTLILPVDNAVGVNDNPDPTGAIRSNPAGYVEHYTSGAWDRLARYAELITAINNLVNAAPGSLDTLKELADALGDDPNFAATITGLIALKAQLAGGNSFTGTQILTNGDLRILAGVALFQNSSADISYIDGSVWRGGSANLAQLQRAGDFAFIIKGAKIALQAGGIEYLIDATGITRQSDGKKVLFQADNVSALTNDAGYATSTAVTTAIATAVNNLVNAAPGSLDTLKELADALGDDPNFAATITTLIATKATILTPTTVKTAAYTAAVNDFIPVSTAGGNVVITLPAAPANKSTVGIKMILQTATNIVTINAGGTDVFNKIGGSTSLTLKLVNQGITLQYAAGIWYVLNDDLPLGGLDARYQAINSVRDMDLIAWTNSTSYALTAITRDGNEAIVTASVVWPDGSTGTFTADTFSTAFPGAIDAYHITYIPPSGPTRTITQSLLTRDAAGAVTVQPALTII